MPRRKSPDRRQYPTPHGSSGAHDRELRIKSAAGYQKAAVAVLNYGDGAIMNMIDQEAGYSRDKSPCIVSNQVKVRSLSDPLRPSIASGKYNTFCMADRKMDMESRPGVCYTIPRFLISKAAYPGVPASGV
ncbi:hypothetical protein BP6252_01723 [Coleophoma cylindrospora]|uniref:Uncharacterized protein n=1 Tax=Coleophoma cylindrospora TaxID=1849047 RepID=A0A3D8SU37_9HELO|nr:hypothetical protein BP6252_01723 [Coleophoma cylindrospora]